MHPFLMDQFIISIIIYPEILLPATTAGHCCHDLFIIGGLHLRICADICLRSTVLPMVIYLGYYDRSITKRETD
ncbi:hypothetical protein A6M27_11920 [Acidithiobacillus thiooxidans]|jgi:hypothetical protein|nr:hypothetical protein A6P07_14265 [Acidithiobacillus thiooxidans]OCX75148.1 hypothetical protein A6M23_03595 [Acidithiobacillus thiooxidans]OCX77703.1 hypothetical protein A6P08_20840 [Acidithiobacillus thiooxidans]OCX79941.1 hypothetical protein A6O24_00300 [Acidithiobacillus thiooxidans]OCX82626.1 hypothetical protein A6O26_09455 [Acidithiobacillus thiooxidans]